MFNFQVKGYTYNLTEEQIIALIALRIAACSRVPAVKLVRAWTGAELQHSKLLSDYVQENFCFDTNGYPVTKDLDTPVVYMGKVL